jgi:predicted lipoprotein
MPVFRKILKRFVFLFSVSWFLVSFLSCTIVRHGEPGSTKNAAAQAAASNAGFDAAGFVKTSWKARIEPELVNNAEDIREVLAALKADPAAAEKKIGRRKEETAPFNYIVKGKAVIKSMNTQSAAGTIELDIPDLSGEGGVLIQIGPVIKSSAVRDVLSFINFGDFVNQLDFANISREINFYVRDNVVAGMKGKTGIVGKHLSFIGAFTEDSTGRVLVTPIQISVEE